MAGEALERGGMHFDDLNRIRVLDEDTASQVDSFSAAAFPSKKLQESVYDHQFDRLKNYGRFAKTFWATLETSRKSPTASSSSLTPCPRRLRPRRWRYTTLSSIQLQEFSKEMFNPKLSWLWKWTFGESLRLQATWVQNLIKSDLVLLGFVWHVHCTNRETATLSRQSELATCWSL